MSRLYWSADTLFKQLSIGHNMDDHCTGIAEVMGSNPVQAWMFFQALISQLLKLCV